MINEEFARRIELEKRVATLASHSAGLLPSIAAERANAIDHPFLTVARERYDRVAAAAGVEPRDPFLDRRVVEFTLRLPGEQTFECGWPKILLRRAMDGELPATVAWRRGRDHLGVAFTHALVAQNRAEIRDRFPDCVDAIREYIDAESLAAIGRAVQDDPISRPLDVLNLLVLGDWLLRQ